MNLAALTVCQRAVFDQLVQGKSNRDISAVVRKTEKTVKAHVTAIFKHFGCASRAELIARHYRGET